MVDPELSKEEFREEDLEIVDTEKKKHLYSCDGDISNDVNRQVQLLNHIVEEGRIVFII